MKIPFILILSFFTLPLLGQNIDSLGNAYNKSLLGDQYQLQNVTDKNGLKQGYWTHYQRVISRYSYFKVGPFTTIEEYTPKAKYFPISEGHYLNGVKIGEWKYYHSCENFSSNCIKTAFYSEKGELLKTIETFTQLGRHIDIVNDSSEVFVHLQTGKFSFLINCLNTHCECMYHQEVLYTFPIRSLNLEMDKLQAGMYNRHIIHQVKIESYD